MAVGPILFSAKLRVSSCSVPFVPVVSDALSMKCRGTSGQVGAEEESVRFWGYMSILAAWVSLRRFRNIKLNTQAVRKPWTPYPTVINDK